MTQYRKGLQNNDASYGKSVSEGPAELRARNTTFTTASSSGENGRVALVVEAGREGPELQWVPVDDTVRLQVSALLCYGQRTGQHSEIKYVIAYVVLSTKHRC
jgi:hypothetical protein